MKLALLSDIHANIQALEACLAHARDQGAEFHVFLGDLVGYGADPSAVIACIAALPPGQTIAILGNHDAMALKPPNEIKTVGDSTAAWTHRQLSAVQREWLAALPLTARRESALFVHASADNPERWKYVYDARAAHSSLSAATADAGDIRHVFGGHVHLQTLYYRGAGDGLMAFAPQPGISIPVPRHRQWLGTVGSVGQPRDGDSRAMYTVFDDSRCVLTFHRVAYDYLAAAQAIRRVGLPDFFAERLEQGR